MTPATSPQDLVEHALAASTSDGCVVIVEDSTSANLRWANNTLTTNGVMHDVSVTVVAFHGTGQGAASGSVSASASTADQVTPLVAAADAAAQASSPAEDAAELLTGEADPDWLEPSGDTSIDVYRDFAPALGEAFGRASSEGRLLYGFVDHEVTTTYLGSSTGLRLRHVQPTGHYGCTAKPDDLSTSAWVGGATRDFTDVDAHAMDAELVRRLGWAGRRVDLRGRPLRHDPAADGGLRPDDLRLLALRRARRPRRPVGLLQARRRHPDRRAALRQAAAGLLRPGLREAPGPPVRRGRLERRDGQRLRQRHPAHAHRLGPRRHAVGAAADPALRRADRAAADAVRRQPRRAGRRRHRQHAGPRRRRRARAAADLPVVHPRGRPAEHCCSPASPATASTSSRTARSPARSTTSGSTRARST